MKRIFKIIFIFVLFFASVLVTDTNFKTNSENTNRETAAIVTPSNTINQFFEKI